MGILRIKINTWLISFWQFYVLVIDYLKWVADTELLKCNKHIP